MKIRDSYRQALIDLFIEQVTAVELGNAVNYVREQKRLLRPEFRVQVDDVVNDAVANDWLGALLDRLAAIKTNASVSRTRDEIVEMLEASGRDGVFSAEALDQLIDLVDRSELDDAELLELYRQSIPKPERRSWSNLIDLRAVLVYRLADISGPAMSRPLLVFAQHLISARDDKKHHTALRAWVKSREKELMIKTQARRIEKERTPHLHLVVVVAPREPEGDADGECVLSAWRVLEEDEDGRWTYEDSKRLLKRVTTSEETLDRQVIELIPQLAEELRKAKGSMTIHLFLPVRLFRCAADIWQYAYMRNMQPVPLGSRFKVLVRPWERNYNPEPAWDLVRIDWEQLWNDRTSRPEALQVCDPDGFSKYRAKKIAGAALSFVPDPNDFTGTGRLMVLIMSGTPVAVWSRCDPATYRAEFTDLLQLLVADPAPDWRCEVFRLREAAAQADDEQGVHLGRHIALLWDDPNQRPIDAPNVAEMREAPHVDD